MKKDLSYITPEILKAMLRPIIGICLRFGIKLQDFEKISQSLFLTEAINELSSQKADESISRLSAMTGIRRPTINQLLQEDRKKYDSYQSTNLITKIIGAWQYDKRFSSKSKAKSLTYEGLDSEFAELVRAVSSDLNHHTILFELIRLKLVEKKGDLIKLKSPAHITDSPTEGLKMLSQDVNWISKSIQENITAEDTCPNLHARTIFDNIPESDVQTIKKWILEFGKKTHQQIRDYLSKFDRDLNPGRKINEKKAKVILGTFSYSEVLSAAPDSNKKKSAKKRRRK